MTLTRYKENLRVVDNKVYSYNTHVATIHHDEHTVQILGWWSVTTSKHINYVASVLNYKTIK